MFEHIAANADLGYEARVTLLDNGRYSVTIYDTDAEETLPSVLIYTDRAAAIAKADKLAAA